MKALTEYEFYRDEYAVVYCGDCRDVLPLLDATDMLLTSPPYLNQRNYDFKEFDWYTVVPSALRSVKLRANGQMFVNLGLIHRDGEVIEYWREMIDALKAEGMRFFGWYVWDQQSGLPGDWGGRLAPSHEWVFHFNRTGKHPNKTKKSVSAGRKINGGSIRLKDGSVKRKSQNGQLCGDFKIPDSVIRIARQNTSNSFSRDHPAVFPEAFAKEFLLAYAQPGDTVMDCFAGSGTVARAAKDLAIKSVSIEMSERHCAEIAERLRQGVLPLVA